MPTRKKSKIRKRKISRKYSKPKTKRVSKRNSKRNSRSGSRKSSKRNSRRRFKMSNNKNVTVYSDDDMMSDDMSDDDYDIEMKDRKPPKKFRYVTQKYIDFKKIQRPLDVSIYSNPSHHAKFYWDLNLNNEKAFELLSSNESDVAINVLNYFYPTKIRYDSYVLNKNKKVVKRLIETLNIKNFNIEVPTELYYWNIFLLNESDMAVDFVISLYTQIINSNIKSNLLNIDIFSRNKNKKAIAFTVPLLKERSNVKPCDLFDAFLNIYTSHPNRIADNMFMCENIFKISKITTTTILKNSEYIYANPSKKAIEYWIPVNGKFLNNITKRQLELLCSNEGDTAAKYIIDIFDLFSDILIKPEYTEYIKLLCQNKNPKIVEYLFKLFTSKQWYIFSQTEKPKNFISILLYNNSLTIVNLTLKYLDKVLKILPTQEVLNVLLSKDVDNYGNNVIIFFLKKYNYIKYNVLAVDYFKKKEGLFKFEAIFSSDVNEYFSNTNYYDTDHNKLKLVYTSILEKPPSPKQEIPIRSENKRDNDYYELLYYIYNNDIDKFITSLKNETLDIFYFPVGKKTLLEEAIILKNQKMIDAIVNLEMEHRIKGRQSCYQVYSPKYLKLIEGLSEYDKPVDFFSEQWSHTTVNGVQTTQIEPLQALYNSCMYNRQHRSHLNPCKYPNIRWHSGDYRHLNYVELLYAFIRTVNYFIVHKKLVLTYLKNTLKNFLPNMKHFINPDIKSFFTILPLFDKEIKKSYYPNEINYIKQKLLDFIVEYFNVNKINPRYIEQKMKEVIDDNTYEGTGPETMDNDPETISIFQNLPKENTEEFSYVTELVNFYISILNMTAFILDIYTILRIFKRTDVQPYYVYGYFGNTHTTMMTHFFTSMLNWYTVDIRKDYTADCRCIKFEPNEYIENSKEIRQLSGPVSFYRLKAINAELRPQYITLFGDHHFDSRFQCKECNADYIQYYKERYPSIKKSIKQTPSLNENYTGVIITSDMFEKYDLNIFNNFITAYNSDCDNIAYIKDYDAKNQIINPKQASKPFVIPQYQLILVVQNVFKEMIVKDPRMLNNFEEINPLGMALITYNTEFNRVEIYSLCLISMRESGYGKVLTKLLFDTAQNAYPKSDLWLGIDLRNEHFSKVAKLYTRSGFENPTYGEQGNIKYIGLTRFVNKIKLSNVEREYKKTMEKYQKIRNRT